MEGHDHRIQLAALLRVDGGGVDQRGDGPAVGHLDNDLLGPHRFAGFENLRKRELRQGDLPPVLPPDGDDLEEVLDVVERVGGRGWVVVG